VSSLPLFFRPQGFRVSELGLGMLAGDGDLGPCVACMPARFTTGMSSAPLCSNTENGRVGGKV
jgi:hypothetical protein